MTGERMENTKRTGFVKATAHKFDLPVIKLEGEESWWKAAHGFGDIITADLKGKNVELTLNGNGHVCGVQILDQKANFAATSGATTFGERPTTNILDRDTIITRQVAAKCAAEIMKADDEQDFFKVAERIELWILRGRRV